MRLLRSMRTVGKLRVALAVAAVMGVSYVAPRLIGPLARGAYISDEIIDFGNIDRSSQPTRRFTIRNLTTSVWDVSTATGCPCLEAKVGATRVGPGEATVVQVRLEPGSLVGDWHGAVLLRTGRPSRSFTIAAKARIADQTAMLSVSAVDLGVCKAGDEVTRRVWVNDVRGYTISSAESERGTCRTRIQGGSVVVQFRGAAPGAVDDTLVIKLLDAGGHPMRSSIPIRGHVMADLDVPERVYAGFVKRGATIDLPLTSQPGGAPVVPVTVPDVAGIFALSVEVPVGNGGRVQTTVVGVAE